MSCVSLLLGLSLETHLIPVPMLTFPMPELQRHTVPPADLATVRLVTEAKLPLVLRGPVAMFSHPWLQPGASYRNVLWDWDALFCGIALAARGTGAQHLAGSALNLLAHQASDGSVPYNVNLGKPSPILGRPRPSDSAYNSCKPILAQMLVLAARNSGDWAQAVTAYPALVRHAEHWNQTQYVERFGLYTWRSHRGNGTDNHPALYGRPFDSSAGPDLNTYFVREFQALAILAGKLGLASEQARWRQAAEDLTVAINRHLWDPVDGCCYHGDVQSRAISETNQPVTWVVPLKYKAWTAVMPLWAQLLPTANAVRFIGEHLLNPAEFWAPHGIYSLARNEAHFNVAASENPSNWQGPVWIIANYLSFRALLNYGFRAEAAELARKTVSLLAEDIRRTGTLHECYEPETGAPIMKPDFINWNLLGETMALELECGQDFTALE